MMYRDNFWSNLNLVLCYEIVIFLSDWPAEKHEVVIKLLFGDCGCT